MSDRFPFSPVGAALLCEWTDADTFICPLAAAV
jgi:hypothetical protein